MEDARNEMLESIEPAVNETERSINVLLNGNEKGTNEFFEELFRKLFCEREKFSNRIVVNCFLEVFEKAYNESDVKGKETIRHTFLNSECCKAYFGNNLLIFIEEHFPSE